MKRIVQSIAAAAMLGAVAGAPSMALGNPETFVFRVQAEQLTTPADAQRAYQRLSEEANRYCAALDLGSLDSRAACRIDVIAGVVDAVGDDRLTELHGAQLRERTLAAAG